MNFLFRDPIEGGRLRLRPLDRADFAVWCELRRDADVIRFVSDSIREGQEEPRFSQELDEATLGNMASLVACDADGGRVVGQCHLLRGHLGDLDGTTAELVVVVRASERRRGYGTEAARLAIQGAWTLDWIERVAGRVARDNHASQKLVRILGMLHAGRVCDRLRDEDDDVFVIARPRA